LTDWCRFCHSAVDVLVRRGEEGAELQDEALDLLVKLRFLY